MFNPLKEMNVLTIVPVSKASAIQRAGRAGRTKAGKCFRLYTKETFESLDHQSTPEISRIELSKMILELKALGITNVVRGFDFVDSPNSLLIERGLEFLVALGALDLNGNLTDEIGLKMAEMPIDPMMAKILLHSEKFGCSEEILTIAAMTSVQNVFMIGGEFDVQGELSRRKFTATEGDHLTYLNVYNAFIKVGRSTSKWCQKYRLNFKALSRAISIRSQLKQYLKKFSIRLVSSEDPIKIRMSLVSGYFRNLARFNEDGSYSSVRDGTVLHVHPSSVMFNRKPETGWVIFHELMETKKRFIRDLTVIEPDWLPELAGHYYQVLNKKAQVDN
ncbi:P-loop containing nucleoside triphosphate hydrolase protein [Melampsora americana]|nr:P-loop containing nucleoside triphosphate hydrolase protein [Melampsora americana]